MKSIAASSCDLRRQAILKRPIDPPGVAGGPAGISPTQPGRGTSVTANQLEHLVQVSQLRNISLRIVPTAADYHPGIVSGSFTVLRFPLNGGGVDSEPPTVYQEMYTGALYLDKPAEVERFDAAFEAIWETALDERSSRKLIGKIAEDMRHG